MPARRRVRQRWFRSLPGPAARRGWLCTGSGADRGHHEDRDKEQRPKAFASSFHRDPQSVRDRFSGRSRRHRDPARPSRAVPASRRALPRVAHRREVRQRPPRQVPAQRLSAVARRRRRRGRRREVHRCLACRSNTLRAVAENRCDAIVIPIANPVKPHCEQSQPERFPRKTPRVATDVHLSVTDAPMNIAMISAKASPLVATGGADAGEQSVHVAELSAALERRGHRVTVYTRRDDPRLSETVETPQGYTVIHVPAGAPERLTDDGLLQAMGPFARYLAGSWTASRPDIAHAHFWMSGIATELVARQQDLPTVLRFHGLGTDGPRRRVESKLAR